MGMQRLFQEGWKGLMGMMIHHHLRRIAGRTSIKGKAMWLCRAEPQRFKIKGRGGRGSL